MAVDLALLTLMLWVVDVISEYNGKPLNLVWLVSFVISSVGSAETLAHFMNLWRGVFLFIDLSSPRTLSTSQYTPCREKLRCLSLLPRLVNSTIVLFFGLILWLSI